MKKKILIISGFLLLIAAIVLLLILSSKKWYVIKVSIVDDQSPDRILTVYDNDNNKVEVVRIEYLDGTLLCNGYNTTVHFGDIDKEKSLRIILNDKSEYEAKIVEEEVK